MVKTGSDECSMVLVLKVFLVRVLGKRVPLRRTTVQKKSTCGWECFSFGNLEGEIVRNPSVSISPTLVINEKVGSGLVLVGDDIIILLS